jgi:triosephosphate isomerase
MHGTPSEAARLTDALLARLGDTTEREVIVAPPFPALAAVAERTRGTPLRLAAQNLHWEDCGAFTGEVSAPMLVDIGCSHVIVGHSERRQYFAETDEWVARKVEAALRHGLTPILCVGESLAEREANRTLPVVEGQIRAALGGLGAGVARVVVAYEPVWAIGTGKVASPAQAEEVHAAIRRLVAEIAGSPVAAQLRILYGGSVKPDNIDSLMREPDIDGALVGGASLQADDFARIVHFRD